MSDHDSMIKRNRVGRLVCYIISLLLMMLIPMSFMGSITQKLFNFSALGLALGFGFGVFLNLRMFQYFWITVPQTVAFVTTSLFSSGSSPNIAYGPGGHFAYPWEMRAESGNITLDVLTCSFTEKVPTKDTSMIVDGTLQFKFDLEHIATVVGIDITTIEQGFLAQVNEWLSTKLAGMAGNEAKNSIRTIRAELETEFMRTRCDQLLHDYGIRVLGFQISSIDFPPKVQEVRDSIEEARAIGEGVAMILGFSSATALKRARNAGKISEEAITRAREDFLAASGNIGKTVNRIDASGLSNVGAGAGIIAGLAQKGGK